MCEAIKLPFGVVSGVVPGTGVLDGGPGPHPPRGRGGFRSFLPTGLNSVFECILNQKCIQPTASKH